MTATYWRRRAVVVVALLALVGVLVWWFVGRSDDDDSRSDAAPDEVEDVRPASEVLDPLRSDPCSLATQEEVAAVAEAEVGEGRDDGGLCTYETASDPATQVTLQAFGPLTVEAYDRLTADGDEVDDVPRGRWLAAPPGGRVLGLDGAVVVEVGVASATLGATEARDAATQLAAQAAARVLPNRNDGSTGEGSSADDGPECSFLDGQGLAEVLPDATAEAPPGAEACRFTLPGGSIVVEQITTGVPELSAIQRSSGTEGEVEEWPREELDVADGAVWLVPPGDVSGTGELYVRQGDALLHLSVSGVEEPKELAVQIASTWVE